jgi:hypothetical protein
MEKTETKAPSKKRVAKAPKANRTARGYVAIHSTDLMVSLAAGMLRVDNPEGGAGAAGIDGDARHFAVHGLPVPAAALAQARASHPYGQVVLIEIDLNAIATAALQCQEAQLPRSYPVPLPLVFARRALFDSSHAKKDFLARAGGYGDVPEGVLELAVDAKAFGGGNELPLTPHNNAPLTPAAEAAQRTPSTRSIDKLAGAIAAALSMAAGIRASNAGHLDAIIGACLQSQGEPVAGEYIACLAAKLDPSEEEQGAGIKLTRAASRFLIANDSHSGIDPEAFLARLQQEDEASTNEGRSTTMFAKRALDVLAGRHDLADDAFADVPGKIVPRALLLFLLNPDATRLANVSGRIDKLGQKVHLLSMAFAGWYAGLGGLDRTIKFRDRDAFLALGLLAWKAAWGLPLSLDKETSWGPGGACKTVTKVDGLVIAHEESAPPPEMLQLHTLVTKLGSQPAFDIQTGALDWNVPGAAGLKVSARQGNTATFPRQPALELFALLGEGLPGKEQAKLVQEIAREAKQSGIFAELVPRGKSKLIELSAICPLAGLDAAALACAVDAIARRYEVIREADPAAAAKRDEAAPAPEPQAI